MQTPPDLNTVTGRTEVHLAAPSPAESDCLIHQEVVEPWRQLRAKAAAAA